MKTFIIILLSSLTLIVYNVNTTEESKEVNIDSIIAKSEKNLSKAVNITKLADQQQKEKMVEMHDKVEKLEKEKVELQETLIQTQNELQVVKATISNPIDSCEQFNLFSKDKDN